jgi:hypothetical protein
MSRPLSGAGLTLFFQESRSCLRKVTLDRMVLSEDQCLALATMSRLDVELVIHDCSLADDAAGAFVECLQQSDRGPIKLDRCEIDNQILANALTGDSRVTRLKPYKYYSRVSNDIAILFMALANNRGLVNLDLLGYPISDENWTILYQSLSLHPSLTNLKLRSTRPTFLTDGQKAHRICLLAEMVQYNTSLHTIEVTPYDRDQKIYTEMIHPYLETNRYRPRVLAITKAAIPLRRPLLGLALQTRAVRNESNLLWIFLSANPDVVVLSNEDAGEQVMEAASIVEPVEAAASGLPPQM